MKNRTISTRVLSFLVGILFLIPAMTVALQTPAHAVSAPTVSYTKYYSCYTRSSSGRVYGYESAKLTGEKVGYIDAAKDECRIVRFSGKAVEVNYPTPKGWRRAYFHRSSFSPFNLAGSGHSRIVAQKKITTYRRYTGGTTFGSISKGDGVTILGTQGSRTQVIYPVGSHYKLGWVNTSQLNAGATITARKYNIATSINRNFLLDVSANGTSNGTNIQIYAANQSTAQQFYVYRVSGSWYKIVHVRSGKVIDVTNGSKASQANVQLYQYNGSAAQLWKFIPYKGGYLIQNKLGNYLDVSGGQAASGTNVWVYSANYSAAQIWYLSPVSSSNLVSPVPSGAKFTKKTNDNGWYGYHDINRNVSTSTPVYAITNGTAYFYQCYTNGRLRSYGNYIRFVSSDGKYEVRMAHLSRFNGINAPITADSAYPCSGAATKKLIATRNVSAGNILGYVGTTGNSSGVHLHIEVYKNGKRVDPTTLFTNLI